MYRAIRLLPVALLLLHLFLKLFIQSNSLALDLFLYNAIWLFAIAAITQAPLSNDPVAVATTSLAIGFWGVGSLLNSYADFYTLSNTSQFLAQLSYVFFYPLLLVAIPRTLSRGRHLNPIEVLDSAIFGLGISAIATAAFLSKVFPESIFDVQDQFFSLLFPVSDLLLLTLAAIAVITHRLQKRALLLFLGILIFSASDLFYLWLSVNNSYTFGQITDDGWLIGIVVIANSFWHAQSSTTSEITIHPVFIALSIFYQPHTSCADGATSRNLLHLYLDSNDCHPLSCFHPNDDSN